MSKRKVVAMLADLFGVEMALGSVTACAQETSEVLAAPVARRHVRHGTDAIVSSVVIVSAILGCESPGAKASGAAPGSVSSQATAAIGSVHAPLASAAKAAGGARASSTSAALSATRGPTDPPMVRIPSGAFKQGSAGETGDDFAWQHVEAVPAFEIDVTEVTVEAYQACLSTGACAYPPRSPDCNLERPRDEYRRDPVACVTWAEAAAYCAWRGAELPTDAMWEYAAGGRRGEHYPWDPKLELNLDRRKTPFRPRFEAKNGNCREGNSLAELKLPSRAGYRENTTCPVGSLPHGDTLDGVKDMAGNVSEWTQTPYCRHAKKHCDSGFRTVKGSAFDGLGLALIEHRLSVDETTWRPSIGFRCARPEKSRP